MRGGPSGLPAVPVVPAVPVAAGLGVVEAQALLIYGVNCRRGIGALVVVLRALRVREYTGQVIWKLLGVGRCWGKRLSSVVVYLGCPVVI